MKFDGPLILTSCVNPSANVPYLTITNGALRKDMTLHSLCKWQEINPGMNVVLCDGSGYDFSEDIQDRFQNLNIECLAFKNSWQQVEKYGKGYGEGEILKYALVNSLFLKEADCFAKCTARLWVENFQDCLSFWNHKFICRVDINFLPYLNSISLGMVDTRFFMISKKLFVDNFSNAYLSVNDRQGYFLEHAYRDVIINTGMEHFIMPRGPIIRGISGSSGIIYDDKFNFNRYAQEPTQLAIAKKISRFVVQ